jgi:hypothetical protein
VPRRLARCADRRRLLGPHPTVLVDDGPRQSGVISRSCAPRPGSSPGGREGPAGCGR